MLSLIMLISAYSAWDEETESLTSIALIGVTSIVFIGETCMLSLGNGIAAANASRTKSKGESILMESRCIALENRSYFDSEWQPSIDEGDLAFSLVLLKEFSSLYLSEVGVWSSWGWFA